MIEVLGVLFIAAVVIAIDRAYFHGVEYDVWHIDGPGGRPDDWRYDEQRQRWVRQDVAATERIEKP